MSEGQAGTEVVVETEGTSVLANEGSGGDIDPNPSTDTSGTWLEGMSDEQVGAIQNSGFKNAGALFDSYSELRKTIGVPADQIIKMPNEGESWDDVYSRLGRPSEASEYVYNTPEGVDASQANPGLDEIRDTFFDNGGSANLFTAVTDKYEEILAAQGAATLEEAKVKQEMEVQSLQQKLGDEEYKKTIHNTNITAAALEFDENVLAVLEKGLGLEGTIKVLAKMRDTMGEDTVDSVNNISPYGETNEQLIDKKATLMAEIGGDPTRLANFNKGVGPDVLAYNRLLNSIDYSTKE